MRRVSIGFGIGAAILLIGALGALVQQWRIDARDDFSFVDCDSHRQMVSRDDRFVIIVGDSGCMRLLRTPDNLTVTCTVDKRVTSEKSKR